MLGDRIHDDVAYTEDLGLVERESGHLRIANPIYQQVIPRALAYETQATVYHETEWYVANDGRLDVEALLRGFLDFWREHGDAMLRSQPYQEVPCSSSTAARPPAVSPSAARSASSIMAGGEFDCFGCRS